MRGAGSAIFVAILLLIAGILNVVYGIAAISDANFYDGTQYAFSSLHTWGWITDPPRGHPADRRVLAVWRRGLLDG